MTAIKYRTVSVDGLKIFYREAGAASVPALLLLHGFPSASHMFRDLIPLLADRFHIIAPDLPGFGQSDMPARGQFKYTFDNIAGVIDRFTEVVGLDRFAVYVFDYGAPTGFRIAVKHPERITAIISQNGNAYEEGLSDGWNPIRAYCSMGQERSLLPAGRCGGVQTRHSRRGHPLLRHRPLRAGDACRRNRGGNPRLPTPLNQPGGARTCSISGNGWIPSDRLDVCKTTGHIARHAKAEPS